MKYSDLNKTQKRCIDAFVKLRPELASKPSITRSEIEDIFAELFAARDRTGEKIGYPMWLVKGEKVSRGTYVFPAPKLDNEQVVAVQPKAKQKTVKVQEEEKEFFTDLKEYGIMEAA